MSEIIYLDLCSLKRPFDDAAIERVRREAEAVAAIMEAVLAGRFRLVQSPAHEFENERNPREDRRLATSLWLKVAKIRIEATSDSLARGRELAALGFGPLDALHLSFAEVSGARWFVTTDDRLLKRADSHRQLLQVDAIRPDQVPLEEHP